MFVTVFSSALAIAAAASSTAASASSDRFLFCDFDEVSTTNGGQRTDLNGKTVRLTIGVDNEDLMRAKITTLVDPGNVLRGMKFPVTYTPAEASPSGRKLAIFATSKARPMTQIQVWVGSTRATIMDFTNDSYVIRSTGVCVPSWEFDEARANLHRELQK